MDEHENIRKIDKLAREILMLSRNTLLVNMRFLDLALSQFELFPIGDSTLLTDGRHILYNPWHVLASYKNGKEIPVRDYLHMVMHCVFRHMYMDPSLDRPYWDLACDIAVENVITELGLKSVSTSREQQQSRYITAVKKDLTHVTAEKIYSFLKQTEPDYERIAEIQELFRADNHEIWYMTVVEIELKFGLKQSGGSSDENSNDSGEDGKDGAETSSRSAMAQVWADISQRMQTDLEMFSKMHGNTPGDMIQNLKSVNREKFDYADFLWHFSTLGEAMKVNDDEFDYIFYTYGMKLYEKMPLIEPLEYKEVRRVKEFVIAIDTSGSVSGELVQKFVQKTYNILKQQESFFTKINLHIIQCDAAIQEDVKITSQNEFDEYLKTMQLRGFGGTDFRPVFNYVDNLIEDKEFTNLKGLIYFTDGYGTFPESMPPYHTAFVFVNDDYEIPQVPVWAIKLILQSDEI